jgi:hypothetical protein
VRRRGAREKVPSRGVQGWWQGQKVIQILVGGKIQLQEGKRGKKLVLAKKMDLPGWEKTKEPQVILANQGKESTPKTEAPGSHQALGWEEEKDPA